MSARSRENKLTSSKNRRNRQSAKKNKRKEIIEKKRQDKLQKQKEFINAKIACKRILLGLHFLGTYARCKQSYPAQFCGWMRIDRTIYEARFNTIEIYIIL